MLHTSVSDYYSNINNINYDCEFLCTYKLHSDDDDRNLCYQLQLLQALKITNYDSMILKEKYKDTNIAFMIDANALFQLLFSYDYFDVFHKCLCKYISEKKQKNENELAKTYFDELKNII